ncbi:MAG: winged helix-turn-helix domain-containing protein [Candidatus Methylomirabilia bacterium]
MKILLVEDDPRTARFIQQGLRQAGFSVEYAADGEAGLHSATSETYDAAVIDIMLPKLDGLSLVRSLRGARVATPILLLSAKSSVDDRVKGLEAGGDDYLVKPFAFSELLARLQALIRRATHITEPVSLTLGNLTLELIKRKVYRGEQEIELQPREFALLEYLLRNAGRVVSKTMIIEHVWDYNFDPETNVVELRISRLRDKIDRGTGPKLIHTVRGAGYVLEER